MALTATMRRFEIALADSDRELYETLELRVAQHPSESERYLVARVLARALEHAEGVDFTRGLAADDEPALWQRDLRGDLQAWIEVGLPAVERLHRAAKASPRVAVYGWRNLAALLVELRERNVHKVEADRAVRAGAGVPRRGRRDARSQQPLGPRGHRRRAVPRRRRPAARGRGHAGVVTDARRDHWARVVAERAATYWTPARTDELLRGKAVAIRPAEGAVVLRALGILDGDGQLPPQRVGKYFQVNHMIGTLAPTLADLRARHPRLAVVDAGCGRSYLSTALAWCGAQVWDYPLEVLGIDRNPAVIAASAERVERAGLTAACGSRRGGRRARPRRDLARAVWRRAAVGDRGARPPRLRSRELRRDRPGRRGRG
jgi:uncharacterized protein YaeQ